MKNIIFYIFFIALSSGTLAQSLDITGIVKNQHDKPVPFAFIGDKVNGNATYSDSTGFYKLTVNPSSILLITGKGYKAIQVPVKGDKHLDIVLEPGIAGGTSDNLNSANDENVFETHLVVVESPGLVMTKTNREALHGSPYLFNSWVHGYVVNTNNAVVQNPNYLYNYDKVNGSLLATVDEGSVMDVDKSIVKSFILFDEDAKRHMFELVPDIDNKHYVEQISSGKNYKIYKLINTRLIKANYVNNGIAAIGNNYDEFEDQSTYYVLDKEDGKPRKLILKKKAIKETFASQAEKANAFVNEQGSKQIDDDYLKALGNYLNN